MLAGNTYCNSLIMYLPWLKLYGAHWQFVVLVYGCALTALFAIGWVWHSLQKKPVLEFGPQAAETPTNHPAQDGLTYRPRL